MENIKNKECKGRGGSVGTIDDLCKRRRKERERGKGKYLTEARKQQDLWKCIREKSWRWKR